MPRRKRTDGYKVRVIRHLPEPGTERLKGARQLADNTLAILRGRKPPNPVNPEVLKR